MADHDSSALPPYDWTTASATHSWHPALRPHTSETQPPPHQLEEPSSQDYDESLQSTSSVHTPEFGDSAEDDATFQQDETVEEQNALLEHSSSGGPDPESTEVIVVEEEVSHVAEAPHENYEHQADVLDLEHAQAEGAALPLIQDEQPPPVTAPVQSPPSAVQDQPSLETTSHPPIDRTFTDDFAAATPDPIGEEYEIAEKPTVSHVEGTDQWPSAGDDKTFAELLGDAQPAPVQAQSKEPLHKHGESLFSQDWQNSDDSHTFLAESTSSTTAHERDRTGSEQHTDIGDDLLPSTGNETENDLAAAFQAALDLGDEDLLEMPNDELDPSTFFDDDDGLLADDDFLADEVPAIATTASQPAAKAPAARYTPTSVSTSVQQGTANPSALPSTSFAAQSIGRSGGTPDTGLLDVYAQSAASSVPQLPGRPVPTHAQSFADKAKGGYQSPYDLPMEVVKTRRRPPLHSSASAGPAAPPRSSSSLGLQHGMPQQFNATTPSHSSQAPPPRDAASVPPNSSAGMTSTRPTPRSDAGFFAELPLAAKPRSRPPTTATPPIGGISTPVSSQGPTRSLTQPPYQPQIPASDAQQQSPPLRAPPAAHQPSNFGLGLRQPERMPLLPAQPNVSQRPTAPPAMDSSRYSPSQQTSSAPPPTNRYSPAPASQNYQAPTRDRYAAAPVAAPSHAFAPRTSSPLAHQKSQPQSVTQPPPQHLRHETKSPSFLSALQPTNRASPDTSLPGASKYAPKTMSQAQVSPQRPFQPSGPQSFTTSTAPQDYARSSSSIGVQPQPSAGPALPHRRTLSREISFAPPQDERANDALERWKGYPLFTWHSSGSILYTFPKHISVYARHQGLRAIPGPIHAEHAEQVVPLDERNSKFPGPLSAKSKGKKKDITPWLTAKISDMENVFQSSKDDFSIPSELRKRAEEKVLLWKLVKIMVEYDGALDGNTKVVELVRALLLPDLAQLSAVTDLHTPTSASVAAEAVDRVAVLQLRAALLEGQRERAVWLAEEKKLWGHAMLIASTMGPDTWKQIVQSFVRSEVKTVGSDTRSLAYLYQVFGGNSDECIDELVPASARAGFQMMSKDHVGAARNPLEGLDQWRETLALIVGNRTVNDGASIIALGTLLADYGRTEAAHSCYLFARTMIKHSGPDSPDAHFVLLGTSPQDQNFGHDLDSILLTEVYEWASSLSALPSTPPYVPHFQSFKLMHAQQLATHGLKIKAQAYCDHITTAVTSTTKPSPYYHPTFTQSVAELSAFLQQTYAGKGGLFSKPSMNKVSSGAASWFTKFVSGEDDKDADRSGQGSEGSGPFGGVQETSPVSRTGSSADIYNPMMSGFIPAVGPATGSASVLSSSNSQPPLGAPYVPSTAQARYAPANAVPQTPVARQGADAGPSVNRYAPSRFTPVSNQASSSGMSPAFTPDGSINTTSSPEQHQPQSQTYSSPQSANAGTGRYSLLSTQSQAYTAQREYSAGATATITEVNGDQASHVPTSTLPTASEQGFQPYQMERRSNPQTPGSPQNPSVNREGTASIPEDNAAAMGFDNTSYMPNLPVPDYAPVNTFMPPSTSDSYQSRVQAGETSVARPATEYAPPSYGGHEAPSSTFQPYEPDNEPSQELDAPKKKFMLDDDDDDDELFKRAEALKKQQKSQADRDADDAFRKAAEADAARDKGADKKAGWLGGWFGGKKEKDSAPGPIRAKLGEESSFYYDEQLKKWVNKKGGSESSTPAAAAPPPPRGPPSRIASGVSMGPPSGPPSRVSSAGSMPPFRTSLGGAAPTSNPALPGSGPPSRAGTPASHGVVLSAVNGGALGPPSRPSTSLSNATDLDDILGGPPGSKKVGGTLRGKKKGGRYVDVMAK